MKQWLLQQFPFLYLWRVEQLRLARGLKNLHPARRFAGSRQSETLPYQIKKHKSILRRKLGSSDPMLQENKIVNLAISIPLIDGLLIRPGETFSFWNRVGRTTSAKGYLEGLMLSRGEVRSGIGGGLCQLANMLFWLALHSPLQVTERHHHSFDLFPDEGRVVPFGSGTSVFYNYMDLRFTNPTDHAYQLRLGLTENFLQGALYADQPSAYTYRIEERNHRFLERRGRRYRENEIWRLTMNPESGELLREEKLMRNLAEVKYQVKGEETPCPY